MTGTPLGFFNESDTSITHRELNLGWRNGLLVPSLTGGPH
jgi:hypothetical protein